MPFSSCLSKIAGSLLFLLSFHSLKAGQGDTIVVQVFKFGHAQDSTIQFPADSLQFEKILMYYTLKCVPGNNPSCGEWDYLTYTFLFDSTGVLDSTLLSHANFLVSGNEQDSVKYTSTPRYTYYQSEQYQVVQDSILSDTVSTPGAGFQSLPHPMMGSQPDARSQYLWTASELSAAGLTAGTIDALDVMINSCGSDLKWMRLRMKLSSLSSLSPSSYENSGFTTVYEHDVSCGGTGLNRTYLTTPYFWDGISSLVIDVSFDNSSSGADWLIAGDTTTFNSGLLSSGTDYFLDYEGKDYVEIPAGALASIDSAVTVMLWQYGDPAMQPQSDYAFEARDAAGNRVLNSHLPWGNAEVYWDAGNSGTGNYDRINKAALASEFEGQWNHWAFTKDVATGEMHMYVNGKPWHSGTGMTRTMAGITRFIIGANAYNYNENYDGYIDEFSIWNKALDSATIRQWYAKDIAPSHPGYSSLLAYYQFNEGSGNFTSDASPASSTGALMGMPQWMDVDGQNIFRNFSAVNERPMLGFVQGSFLTHVDTTLILDSMQDPIISIELFDDSLNATTSNDTLYVWAAGNYSYLYDQNGNALDSSFITEDTTRYKVLWPYWSEPFEIIDRYELLRYITPYGINLDLGNGWRWVYDMTDYRSLFKGKKRMAGGNWQELLDLQLVFIEGTPPRDPLDVEVLWSGDYGLANFANTVTDKTVQLDSAASEFLVKSRASGHGFSNPTNCAEFCQKNHYLDVNGFQIDTWKIIIECADNPLYPQGGTWIYDRAAWCPGKETMTRNTDISGLVTPGANAVIDYDCDSDPYGNYVFEGQLISYGPKNFTLDAGITDLVSPSSEDRHFRANPVCNNPIVIIRNNGSAILTDLDITYGPKGGNSNTFNWTGNLAFMEEERVNLPVFNWGGWTGANEFEVTIANPNGGTDEYAPNNVYRAVFNSTPVYPSKFFLQWRTNGKANETKWTVKNDMGMILYSSSAFIGPNTIYTDTFELSDGCYTFQLTDLDHDGLEFFANNDGAGFARFRNLNNIVLRTFDPDFGMEISQQFTVGYTLGRQETLVQPKFMNIWPNPTAGEFTLDLNIPGCLKAEMMVNDLTGRTVMQRQLDTWGGATIQDFSISGYEAGIYFVKIVYEGGSETRKIVLAK